MRCRGEVERDVIPFDMTVARGCHLSNGEGPRQDSPYLD